VGQVNQSTELGADPCVGSKRGGCERRKRARNQLASRPDPRSAVKSRQRVADHGEVFTPAWLIEDMLNLVREESERIDARVLEPACGSGNFLVPVLRRKLRTSEARRDLVAAAPATLAVDAESAMRTSDPGNLNGGASS